MLDKPFPYEFQKIISRNKMGYNIDITRQSACLLINKQVSMIRKYHNHTLQTILRHREEDPQSINSHKSEGQLKQISQLFLARQDDCNLERTQINAYQNKDQTQNSHKDWEDHKQLINNNRTTALNGQQQGLKCILLALILCPRFCCC